jgi:tRNA pseudouridine55 synthase
MDGVLLVDKPAGITSAGVVRALKGRVEPRKIGHLGTLDPFATGLLPLCIGEATKVAQFLTAEDKGYTGRIRLGIETDTLDCTGRVLRETPVPAVDPQSLDELARQLHGTRLQTPPMFSAVKQRGVPLYRLARRGIEVERSPRPIEVHGLTLRPAGNGEIDFHLECSKGTYVRVLAADIGRALGCGGHLTALRRVRFGGFDIRYAHPLAALEAVRREDLPVVPVRSALAHLRELVIPSHAGPALRRGQQDILATLAPAEEPAEVATVVTSGGDLVAVVQGDGPRGAWRVARILADTERADEQPAQREGKLYKPHPVC